jgi:hypothetical protein
LVLFEFDAGTSCMASAHRFWRETWLAGLHGHGTLPMQGMRAFTCWPVLATKQQLPWLLHTPEQPGFCVTVGAVPLLQRACASY